MAKLRSGTRIYGTAGIDTSLTVGSGVTITTTSISVSGIITAPTLIASSSVGVNTSSPVTTLDLSRTTGAVALPQGTTAQRPTGNNPYIRYNTTNTALEFYNGTDWVEIISDYFPSGSTILG